jgi:glycosyltransferase involved in cell wall biosynthesis
LGYKIMVSVLINNYNYGSYLEYCINSVLQQTYDDVEIILYDDGSTDNSLEIARKYSDKIILLNSTNFGRYPSFNQGNAINVAFKISRGEIICLLDSDDAFSPHKIEKVVHGFRSDPGLVMIQHRMFEISKEGSRTNRIRKSLIIDSNIMKFILFTQRMDYFFMPTSALSFPRYFLEKVLPIREDKYPLIWPDVRLTRNALVSGRILTYSEPLGEYRIHGINDSDKLKSQDFFIAFTAQYYAYFNELANRHGLPSIQYSKSTSTMLKILCANFLSDSSLKYKSEFLKSLLDKLLQRLEFKQAKP